MSNKPPICLIVEEAFGRPPEVIVAGFRILCDPIHGLLGLFLRGCVRVRGGPIGSALRVEVSTLETVGRRLGVDSLVSLGGDARSCRRIHCPASVTVRPPSRSTGEVNITYPMSWTEIPMETVFVAHSHYRYTRGHIIFIFSFD